jgi:radical SAM family RiPP maturation amino acid epimerase
MQCELEPIGNQQTLDEEEKIKISLSNIKQFSDRWRADANFRKQMPLDPERTIVQYNLQVDPEEVRPIWDADFPLKHQQGMSIPQPLIRLNELSLKVDEDIKAMQLVPIEDAHFQAWKNRQLARCASEFHPEQHQSVVHAPMTFELSKGCSVGCWFCGISASRFSNVYSYLPENARLWQDILELMKTIIGTPAASEGFCYWGTDPLDNPDYDKFCVDFYNILGKFPQMTTAQPLKYPDRVRALLKLARARKSVDNRFSILSLKTFDRVQAEFTSEELAFVKFVLHNPEAGGMKANSGRARERNQQQELNINSAQGTIACVSGFLFNMVDLSVQLISPCNASDRWKDGYIIYDRGTFSDINDLKILLEQMIEKNMPLSVKEDRVIRFRDDLEYKNIDGGFQLTTRWMTRKYRNESYLQVLGQTIERGDRTTLEITKIFEKIGVPEADLLHVLNLLFDKGVLDETR